MSVDDDDRIVALAHYGDELDWQAGVEFRSGVFVPATPDAFDMALCGNDPLVRNALFYEMADKAGISEKK